MKNKVRRLDTLKKMLQVESSLRISDISTRMGVSPMTTRRDLEILSEEGTVRVIHGTVLYNSGSPVGELADYTLTVAETQNAVKKKQIGMYAASFVKENDIIFLDAGSTTEYLAQFLPSEFPFTVVCYSINIFLAVSRHKNIDIILGGGYYDRKTTILQQPNTCELLRTNRTHKAFISAAGLHMRLGVTCSNQGEGDIKKTAIETTVETYLLVDSTKFDKVAACFFSAPERISHIVTNKDLPDTYRRYLADRQIVSHYV